MSVHAASKDAKMRNRGSRAIESLKRRHVQDGLSRATIKEIDRVVHGFRLEAFRQLGCKKHRAGHVHDCALSPFNTSILGGRIGRCEMALDTMLMKEVSEFMGNEFTTIITTSNPNRLPGLIHNQSSKKEKVSDFSFMKNTH